MLDTFGDNLQRCIGERGAAFRVVSAKNREPRKTGSFEGGCPFDETHRKVLTLMSSHMLS